MQFKLMTNVRKMKTKIDPDTDLDHNRRKIAAITKDLESESDIISSLPHDTLRRIVSLLPFRSVIGTSLLSTKWRMLWKMAFLVEDGTIDDAANAIFQFVNGYDKKSRKNNWALQFNFGEGNVLFAAISPYNNTLHLELFTGNCESPRHFNWLLQIKTPPNCSYYSSYPNTFVVRTLHLFGADQITSRVLIDDLFQNFPQLQNLTIQNCNGLQSLRLCGHSGLKRLTILDCLQLKCIHLMNCNLQSFRYRGKLVCYKVKDFDNDYRYMEDLMLDCRQGLGCKSYKILGFHAMLTSFTNIQCLTLSRWVFEMSLIPGTFRFKQLKTLWWIDCSKGKYDSHTLISFTRLCPRLTKLYVTIDASSYVKSSGSGTYPSRDHGRWSRSKLKIVKLEGFESEEEEIAVAIELMKEFIVDLSSVMAQSKGSYPRRLAKKRNEGQTSYKFEKLDTDYICTEDMDHDHMGI